VNSRSSGACFWPNCWARQHHARHADFLKTAIEPLLAPEIYRTVLDAMTDQIKAIKMDRVAISFTPRHVAYETETNKVFVSGELKSQGPSGGGAHGTPYAKYVYDTVGAWSHKNSSSAIWRRSPIASIAASNSIRFRCV
jgi:hypothetical protein